MTEEERPNHHRIHELRGIVGGLEFLGQRIAQKKEKAPATLEAFADAVKRYQGIVELYDAQLAGHDDMKAQLGILLENLNQITVVLRLAASAGEPYEPKALALVAEAIAALHILLSFYS